MILADIHLGHVNKRGEFIELNHNTYEPIKYSGGDVNVKLPAPTTEKHPNTCLTTVFITKPKAEGLVMGVRSKPVFPALFIRRNEMYEVEILEKDMIIFLKTLNKQSN